MIKDCHRLHALGGTIVLATNQAHLFGRPEVPDEP